MISEYYKNFSVKDYMNNEINCKRKGYIDCTLGTNPFIKKRYIKKYIKNSKLLINEYPVNEFELLKEKLIEFYNDKLNTNLKKENISFGSGTMGIIRNLCEFLIEENTKVLGIAPQFTRFISEVELKKGIYEYYKLEEKYNYKFDVNDFLNKIDKNII